MGTACLMDVALVVPYPTEVASNRLRIEQYVPYLVARGWRPRTYRFMSSGFYRLAYTPGRFGAKAVALLRATADRLGQISRIRRADVVVIHREAFPWGPPLLEERLARAGCRIVFDFDDAIYLPNWSPANRAVRWLKRPSKTGRIIAHARHVIAGNRYLAEYARLHNRHVTVIPTPVDTTRFRPAVPEVERDTVTIGWVGSHTTVETLRGIEPVLRALADRYPQVRFLVIGGQYAGNVPRLENRPWALAREVEDLRDIDVGLMPLPDDEWSRGKCGFKALLYMSMGIPPVCSPVGVNCDIVTDGVNGFLAEAEDAWYQRLAHLVESSTDRRRMGAAGRETVERQYSVVAQAPRFVGVLDQVTRGVGSERRCGD
jgi:glycosyltransferase involved in cell wall biosynthesis